MLLQSMSEEYTAAVSTGKEKSTMIISTKNDDDEGSTKSLGEALDATAADGQETESATKEKEVDIDDDVALTFPQRLMEILDDEKNHETIAWLPHGRAFVVLRRKAFEQKILPKYFHKQSKYSSFTRKLNRWGFIRVTRGPETGAYYHTFFQRDGHRLLLQMSCQSGPSKASAASNDPTKGSPSVGPGGGVAAAVLGGSPLALTAGQAVFQQQNQLLQMQIQQQLLQQELTRRALAGQQALQLQQQPQPQLYAQLGSALGARFGGLGTSFGNLPAGLSGAASLPLLGQRLGIPDARLLQFIQQGTTEEKRGGDGDSQGST